MIKINNQKGLGWFVVVYILMLLFFRKNRFAPQIKSFIGCKRRSPGNADCEYESG
jgi:hypothetical protein